MRNVEVTLRDNDTPGVYVTEVDKGTSTEDRRTVVVEGTVVTGLTDDLLVQLAMEPTSGSVVVKLALDADSDAAIFVDVPSCPALNPNCWDPVARTITFSSTTWNIPVRVVVTARDDDRRQDPRTAVITFVEDATTTAPDYVFPSKYAPPVRIGVEVWDDETANVLVTESGGSTLVVFGGAGDTQSFRLTKAPAPGKTVTMSVLTDGLVDVTKVNGVAITPAGYANIGGYQPSRAFEGSVVVSLRLPASRCSPAPVRATSAASSTTASWPASSSASSCRAARPVATSTSRRSPTRCSR